MPSPPHQVTADDVGPAVNVMSWFLTSTTFLAVALRGLTKSFVSSRVTNDDVLIFLSLLIAIGIAATDSVQVANGLGRRFASLTPEERDHFQQASYAGDLLHVLVLVLSKMSILFFYRMLTPVPAHRRAIRVALPLLALWGASSLFVVAFQCRAPRFWSFLDDGGAHCLARVPFYTYFSLSNMLIEAVLVAFPIYIISKIQTNTSKKMLLASCFLARVLVVAALIAETATRARADLTADPTYNFWPVAVSQQLTHSLAIITACIPYYLSWVPHAFRIYANTYSNHQHAVAGAAAVAAGRWRFGHHGGAASRHGGGDHYEMTPGTRGSAGGLRRAGAGAGGLEIQKTVETEVQVEMAPSSKGPAATGVSGVSEAVPSAVELPAESRARFGGGGGGTVRSPGVGMGMGVSRGPGFASGQNATFVPSHTTTIIAPRAAVSRYAARSASASDRSSITLGR